jgi:hypothetical protein
MADDTPTPTKPKREVEKRLPIAAAEIIKDKKLEAAVDAWLEAAAAFAKALEASDKAKKAMQAILGPKLKSKGVNETVRWDVKRDNSEGGGIIVEILKGKKGSGRVSRVPVEPVTF